jgi:hypothetical protein
VLTLERARLLVDDPDGERLRVVKARLAAIDDHLHDVALADEETQRRTAKASSDEQAKRDAEDRARLAVVEGTNIPALAQVVDAGLGHVDLAIERLRAEQRHADTLRGRLGLPTRTRQDALLVAGAVAWRLRDVLGAHVRRPHHAFRRPLAELLGAGPEAPAASPIEEARE